MLYINHTGADPYFNMATEEYILTRMSEDVFMLWVNDNAIIVGVNQNTLAEIDYAYVRTNNIAVVRRLTGGGSVYHDKGNLNYSFAVNKSEYKDTDRKAFQKIITGALSNMGITAELSGRNDITIEGKKISGSAQCEKKGRILHHGTLLLNVSLDVLGKALEPDKEKIESKGIKSVYARVANINAFLENPLTVRAFINILEQYMTSNFQMKLYTFTDKDIAHINELADKKYRTWEWNFGYSPKYNIKNAKRFEYGSIEVNLSVIDGIIKDIKIYGDFFSDKPISGLEAIIRNCRHSHEAIYEALEDADVGEYISGATARDLLEVMI